MKIKLKDITFILQQSRKIICEKLYAIDVG